MDAAIRKAKDSLGTLFDKNLHDLVRGIRNHKENEVIQLFIKILLYLFVSILNFWLNFFKAKYISECIDEIKQELKQDNMTVKANAINKLCYVIILKKVFF